MLHAHKIASTGLYETFQSYLSACCSENKPREELARPEGLEPPTPWFEAKCSIQLSYGRAAGIISIRMGLWLCRRKYQHGW